MRASGSAMRASLATLRTVAASMAMGPSGGIRNDAGDPPGFG